VTFLPGMARAVSLEYIGRHIIIVVVVFVGLLADWKCADIFVSNMPF